MYLLNIILRGIAVESLLAHVGTTVSGGYERIYN